MGLFEKVIKNEKNELTPQYAFDVAIEGARLFPMKYIDEYDDPEIFEGYYETSRSFTALMICCSFVYFVKAYKDGTEPIDISPFKDRFFVPFIALILNEANKIRTIDMMESLSGGFDGEFPVIEELPEYRCMLMLETFAEEIIKISQSHGKYFSTDLAFIYYRYPGSLFLMKPEYGDKIPFTDLVKMEELQEAISIVGKNILLKLI